jgi:23S rRNA pseudouridine1911/1915/1917 synthase
MHHPTHIITPAEGRRTLAEVADALLGTVGLRALERGGAWVDGRRTLQGERVLAVGQRVEVRLPPNGAYAELELTAGDICFEDAWLIALHKRSGWYVGATPWDVEANALAALGRHLAERDGVAPLLHLVHQLDRDTSGVLLFSKDPAVNPGLQHAFATGAVKKQYQAICAGVPAPGGTISTGHGRAAGGRWRIYPLEAVGQTLPGGGGRIKAAHTSYRVLRTAATAAFLEVELHTGRTHQIRLHLAHIGHPLLGDARYGGPRHYNAWEVTGHLLHAAHLALMHPVTRAWLALHSPLPEPMATISRTMG